MFIRVGSEHRKDLCLTCNTEIIEMFSTCVLFFNFLAFSASLEIQPEHHQIIYDKFIEDGLHTLQNVADEMVKFLDQTDEHHSQLEHHLRRKLYYSPTLGNDEVKDMDADQFEREAEKIVHNVVFHLYDGWDHLMEPIKETFAPYEHLITALTANLNYADPRMQEKLKVPPPANETVIDMINGLKEFPEVLRRVNRMMEQTNERLSNDKLDDIDYSTVQQKVMEKFKKANERYQFV